MSDTHGHHGEHVVPMGDIFIHGGDFIDPDDDDSDERYNPFFAWMKSLPHPHKVVTAGNHDLTFASFAARNSNATTTDAQTIKRLAGEVKSSINLKLNRIYLTSRRGVYF